MEDEQESFSNTQTENGNNEETQEETTARPGSEAEDDPVASDACATST